MHNLTRDISLLFAARVIRLFAYGFVSVVLALYLAATGLSAFGVGIVLTATLVGDIFVSNKPPLKLPCLFLYIIILV